MTGSATKYDAVRQQRDVVFIVGVSRSGSSALARVLSLCGGALPLIMLPPNFANPTGYWEPTRAVRLNDDFLLRCRSSWYDGSYALQTEPVNGDARRAFVANIAEFLGTGFEDHGPIVLKEPRISGLLPYWLAGAGEEGMTAKAVHIVRGPAEVAASLAERDGLTVAHSYALWLKYNLFAERDTRELRRVFVSYDTLLRDWERVAERCISGLGLALEIGPDAKRAIPEFLSPTLRHHRRATTFPPAVDAQLAEWVVRVYGILCAAETGPLRSAELDEIQADYLSSAQAEEYCLVRPLPAPATTL